MTLTGRVMEHSRAYRLGKLCSLSRSLRPSLRITTCGEVRRVLDVGCGPGTNTRYFCRRRLPRDRPQRELR
jgi:hypothetical protein